MEGHLRKTKEEKEEALIRRGVHKNRKEMKTEMKMMNRTIRKEKEKINVYINDLEMQRRRMETNEKRINEELLETEVEISDF